jgi:hypothetical protein
VKWIFTPAPSGTASFDNSPAHSDPAANQQETDHAPTHVCRFIDSTPVENNAPQARSYH